MASEEQSPSSHGLVTGLIIWRLLDALSIRTFFQPDEYFQSLEPAWRLAFGPDSRAWITWEWQQGLRAALHPYLFSGVLTYAQAVSKNLVLSRQHQASLLLTAPKAAQAIFAAATDLYTWRLARLVFPNDKASSSAALVLSIFSPWQWFCSVRTFSNCIETTLTVMALESLFKHLSLSKHRLSYNWPSQLYYSMTYAAIACVLRPTNALIWLVVYGCLMLNDHSPRQVLRLVSAAAACGALVVSISLGVDFTYYGELIFPPFKFLYFNLAQSLAIFYGNNRRDYYLTEGLPLLLTTLLPFGIFGLWRGLHPITVRDKIGPQSILALAVILPILGLSCIGHKEVRFIYPLLPILHVLAAKPFATFFFTNFPRPRSLTKSALLLCGLAINILIAFYVTQVHQRGVIDVMHFLRREQELRFLQPSPTNVTAAFLMPCHSTPWRSHLIYPEISAWALTCEPPINRTPAERAAYMDEADVFYNDPKAWIAENMAELNDGDVSAASKHRRPWPEYLIFFNQLQPTMAEILRGTSYRPCESFFNTHWHDDRRRHGNVEVWCKHATKS